MRRFLKICVSLLICISALFQSGCWDLADIDERFIIIGLGIDTSEQAGQYSFTFQIAAPRGQSSGASSNTISYSNVTLESSALATAIRELVRNTNNEANFEHLRSLVIGQGVLEGGFDHMLDSLFRIATVRRRCVVVISEGGAAQLLEARVGEGDTAYSISYLVEQYSAPKGSSMSMFTLSQLYSTKKQKLGYYLLVLAARPSESFGGDAALLQPTDNNSSGSESLAVSGVACFDNGRFTGALGPSEVETVRLLGNRQTEGIITQTVSGGNDIFYSVESSGCTKEFRLNGEKPEFTIILSVKCSLIDAGVLAGGGVHSVHWIEAAREQIVRSLTEDVNRLIDYSRFDLNAELVGLESTARQTDYDWYKKHQKEFQSIYRSSTVTCKVICETISVGFIE